MSDLPEQVERGLNDFLAAAKAAFGDKFASAILFGSAAEGRMRATSDVNLIVVLKEFIPDQMALLTPKLRMAKAAIKLEAMFLLTSEISAAVECFAQKFADIGRRRKVIYGSDPFAGVRPSRTAELFRLRQVLLNLTLRMRESFAEHAGVEDQIARIVADSAGPLRAAAATLIELETGAVQPPKEALEAFAQEQKWREAVEHISELREQRITSPRPFTPTLLAMLEMSDALRRRVEALDESV